MGDELIALTPRLHREVDLHLPNLAESINESNMPLLRYCAWRRGRRRVSGDYISRAEPSPRAGRRATFQVTGVALRFSQT